VRAVVLGLIGAFVLSGAVMAGEYLMNNLGRTARGLYVTFDSPVVITSYGDDLMNISPAGEATEFTFSGGEVDRYGGQWLNWEPADVRLVSYWWSSNTIVPTTATGPQPGDFESAQTALRVVSDETRMFRKSAEDYEEGRGYEQAIDEDAWYGSSDLAKLLRDNEYAVDAITASPITGLALLDDDGRRPAVLMILEPTHERTYTESEISAIRLFVSTGGGLFLASSTWRADEASAGSADAIARAFDVSFRYSGKLHDATDHHSDNLHVVRVSNWGEHPIARDVRGIYYQGTYLDETGGATVVGESDDDAWFDRYRAGDAGDDVKQADEEAGPLPLFAVLEYG